MRRRQTKQRMTILEQLRDRTDHPTADQVYADVRKLLPNISMGTVYRNLDVLSQDGMVRIITVPGKPRRFDGNVHSHDHVRCIVCGTVQDLPDGSLPETDNVQIPGFKITRCFIEIEGICQQCGGTTEKKMRH